MPVLAAVEENVSCSFQKLQDEPGFSCTQSDILSYLTVTATKIQALILKLFNRVFSLVLRRHKIEAKWATAVHLMKLIIFLFGWNYLYCSEGNFFILIISTRTESCHTHHSAALFNTHTVFSYQKTVLGREWWAVSTDDYFPELVSGTEGFCLHKSNVEV